MIFDNNELVARQKVSLNNKCSKNQESKSQFYGGGIKNYLEIANIKPRTLGIHTDTRYNINSKNNASKGNYLIDEKRNRLISLRGSKLKIETK